MSDIVERLHTRAAECERTTAHDNKDHYLHVVANLTREDGSRMKEAADEIERLRAALQKINVGEGWAALIARAALEGK